MIMWLQVVVHGIFNIDYGIPVLNYAYITHACAVYITAVLAWFDRSEASFDADWDEDTTSRFVPAVCATTGPALAIFTIFPFIITTLLFYKVYWMRDVYIEDKPDAQIPSL